MNNRKTALILRKTLSIMLCAALCLGLFPVSAFAQENDDEYIIDELNIEVMYYGADRASSKVCTITTTDGSYNETASYGSFDNVPILSGDRGSTVLTVINNPKTGDRTMKGIRVTLTKEYLEANLKSERRNKLVFEAEELEDTSKNVISIVGENAGLVDEVTVTNSKGEVTPVSFWNVEDEEKSIDGKSVVYEAQLEFFEDVEPGETVHLLFESSNGYSYYETDVTLDENRCAVVAPPEWGQWYYRHSVSLNYENPDTMVGYDAFLYQDDKFVAVAAYDRVDTEIEDPLRAMHGGTYKLLLMSHGIFDRWFEEGYLTPNDTMRDLNTATAFIDDKLDGDFYSVTEFTVTDTLVAEDRSSVQVTVHGPESVFPSSLRLDTVEAYLPESQGGLLAGGEYAFDILTSSYLPNEDCIPWICTVYNGGTRTDAVVMDNKSLGDWGYDGLLGDFSYTGTLPEDAYHIDKFVFIFDDAEVDYNVDMDVVSHAEVKFTGAIMDIDGKMLKITDKKTGSGVFGYEYKGEGTTEDLTCSVGELAVGSYKASLVDNVEGVEVSFGETDFEVSEHEFVTVELPLDEKYASYAKIEPTVTAGGEDVTSNCELYWYANENCSESLAISGSYTVTYGGEAYVKAVPTDEIALKYAPSDPIRVTDETKSLNIELTPYEKVTAKGTVTNGGKPVAGADIVITLANRFSSETYTGTADSKGAFAIENVPKVNDKYAGYTVIASATVINDASVTVEADGLSSIKVEATDRSGVITGCGKYSATIKERFTTKELSFVNYNGDLYLTDPDRVSVNTALDVHLYSESGYFDKTVTLDSNKRADIGDIDFLYYTTAEINITNKYKQKAVILRYKDSVLDKTVTDAIDGSKTSLTYTDTGLSDGEYTYLFVQKDAYLRFGSERLEKLDAAKKLIDGVAKDLYVEKSVTGRMIKASEGTSKIKQSVKVSLLITVPPEGELNRGASDLKISYTDEKVTASVTASPKNSKKAKSLVVTLRTNNKRDYSDTGIADPKIMDGTLVINGKRVKDDDIFIGEPDKTSKNVCIAESTHDTSNFDGTYLITVKDVSAYGSWPLTVKWEYKRTDPIRVKATADVSFTTSNQKRYYIDERDVVDAAVTLHVPEKAGGEAMTVQGTAPKGSKVTLYLNGKPAAAAWPNDKGTFSAYIPFDGCYGKCRVEIKAVAEYNGESVSSESYSTQYSSVYPYLDEIYTHIDNLAEKPQAYKDPYTGETFKLLGSDPELKSLGGASWSYLNGQNQSFYWYLKDKPQCYAVKIGNLGAYSNPENAVKNLYFCINRNGGIERIPGYKVMKKLNDGTQEMYWYISTMFANVPSEMWVEYEVTEPDYNYTSRDMKNIEKAYGAKFAVMNNFFLDKATITSEKAFYDGSDITASGTRFRTNGKIITGDLNLRVDNIKGYVNKSGEKEQTVNESFNVTQTAGTTWAGKDAKTLAKEFSDSLDQGKAGVLAMYNDALGKASSNELKTKIKKLIKMVTNDQHIVREIGSTNGGSYYALETIEYKKAVDGSTVWYYSKADMDTYLLAEVYTSTGMISVLTYDTIREAGDDAYPLTSEESDLSPHVQVSLRWDYVTSSLEKKLDDTVAQAIAKYNTSKSSEPSGAQAEEELSADSSSRRANSFQKRTMTCTRAEAENLMAQYPDRYKYKNAGEYSARCASGTYDYYEATGQTLGEARHWQNQEKNDYINRGRDCVELEDQWRYEDPRLQQIYEQEVKEWDDINRYKYTDPPKYKKLSEEKSVRILVNAGFYKEALQYIKDSKYIDENDVSIYTMQKLEFGLAALDPSGFVYEGVQSNRLEGVTAKIYKVDDEGNLVLWDAAEFEQQNPYTTDENGIYEWMVPEGKWSMTFTKYGYEDYTTGENDGYGSAQAGDTWYMPVSPEQINVNINLMKLTPPEVERIDLTSSSVYVVFDQYMDTETLTADNFTIRSEGGNVNLEKCTFEYPDAEENGGKTFARTVKITLPEGYSFETPKVTVKTGVTSYNGRTLTEDYVKEYGYSFYDILQADTPIFSVEPGVVNEGETVAITCGTNGAKVFYTTDGTDPTTASTYYTGPITITSDMTVKAVAIAPGMDASEAAVGEYTLYVEQVETPDISSDTEEDTDDTDTEDTDTETDTDKGLLGDLDGDGEVTSGDALLILRMSVGLDEITPEKLALADIDGDGSITSGDALEILRFSVGLSTDERIGKAA